ncbi:hypothetical protein [Massilia sp. Bi118]|uniref:hypothetical protein n=1 Tax=Massilia sp. Bi118 TaxID=2822346 RepID=UPI001E3632D3|nr:hypothetical protein [Massilia sp. Bi118]
MGSIPASRTTYASEMAQKVLLSGPFLFVSRSGHICGLRAPNSGAGFPNPGTYPIKAGKYRGRMIETGQRRLSNWLVRHLGVPEKFKSGQAAEQAIRTRKGIVSFFSTARPPDAIGPPGKYGSGL